MDKKYTVIGIAMLMLAFLLMFFQVKEAERLAEDQASTEQVAGASDEEVAYDQSEPLSEESLPSLMSVQEQPESPETSIISVANEVAAAPPERLPEETHILENAFIKVEFTSHGGAIRSVSLKEYRADLDNLEPYVFNALSKLPALSISLVGADGEVHEYAPVYKLVSSDDTSVTFSRQLASGVALIRTYTLSTETEGAGPYLIDHTTRFKNDSQTTFNIDKIYINVGTAPPAAADPQGFYLNFGYYDGRDVEFVSLSDFKGGGFFSFSSREEIKEIQRPGDAVWASVKNQFFTGVLTPKVAGAGIHAKPVKLSVLDDNGVEAVGITGSIVFDLENLQAGSASDLQMQYYVGPKEYARLSKLEKREDLVMQFGFFGFFSKPLLYVLIWIKSMVGSYGLAIVLMTIVIRLMLWPLTSKAAHSAKKMAKIQAPMQELKEKYKDNPEKLQKETLKLFRENKVNPAAGCLPIFVQIPIFLGFFYMLRTASELRFEEFLWIRDLSQPSLITTIGGFPFRLLPILMGVTMFFQMRMTPSTMDNMQKKIFQFLPFIFLGICYNFASGLVLYWTVSNCLSILQQFLTNRSKDPVSETDDKPAPSDKPEKVNPNSTQPKKKRKKKSGNKAKR